MNNNFFAINGNKFSLDGKLFSLGLTLEDNVLNELRQKVKLAIQYKDSSRLKQLIEAIGFLVIENKLQYRNWFRLFNLDFASGDQLTLIGNLIGFPREHCNACMTWLSSNEVFGINNNVFKINGSVLLLNSNIPESTDFILCDGRYWAGEIKDFIFENDEIYKNFIKAKLIYNFTKATINDALNAAKFIFGDKAFLYSEGYGQLIISIGSGQSTENLELLPLAYRIIPTPRGVRLRIINADKNVFGFGEGWGGFCSGVFGTFLPEFSKN